MTKRIALCGVLAALAVTVMVLGTIVPVGTFCCPAVAGLLLIPVLDLCGVRLALGWYAAVSLLSLLLAPDREAALLFLFLGYYPVMQPYFARIPVRALRPCAKLLLFNAAVLLLYGLVCGLLGIPAASDGSAVLLAVMLLLGNVTFFLYDIVIARLTRLWKRRKKRWNL